MATALNVFCTQCGTQNLMQSNFCFKCGNKLQKEVMSASGDTEKEENKNDKNEQIIISQISSTKECIGYNTLGRITRIKSFESEGDYGFGAVKQANEWMEQNADIIVLNIQHFVHPVVKFYVWVNIIYTIKSS